MISKRVTPVLLMTAALGVAIVNLTSCTKKEAPAPAGPVVVGAAPGGSAEPQASASGSPGANANANANAEQPPPNAGTETATTEAPPAATKTTEPPKRIKLSCKSNKDFNELRNELGKIVNDHEMRQHNVPEFLKQLNKFRTEKGLPLPLIVVSGNKLEEEGVVYNCRPSCKGTAYVTFISRLKNGGNSVEVYTKDGKLKTLPLRDSGLEIVTIDELNGKGVPFRSWQMPAAASTWYLSGGYMFYPMDIEGLYLRADTHGNWQIVSKPTGLQALTEVEPAVQLAGCVPEEHCLQIEGKKGRHFKAPRVCEAILKHESDEVANHEDQNAAPKKKTKKGKAEKTENMGGPGTPDINLNNTESDAPEVPKDE